MWEGKEDPVALGYQPDYCATPLFRCRWSKPAIDPIPYFITDSRTSRSGLWCVYAVLYANLLYWQAFIACNSNTTTIPCPTWSWHLNRFTKFLHHNLNPLKEFLSGFSYSTNKYMDSKVVYVCFCLMWLCVCVCACVYNHIHISESYIFCVV